VQVPRAWVLDVALACSFHKAVFVAVGRP
jgi:hypothetical protein